ncbi:MAG: 3,4-dihydroxy-2-butanone-4-phosphate synthase [Alphaproteobacteria bacterium]
MTAEDTRGRDAGELSSVEEAIRAIADGQMVIVIDDDDRENEGDLVMAAAKATPAQMAFIIRNTCGIVCAPMAAEEARRLHLDPMVAANDAPLGTAFTISVDYRYDTTTGISAEERCTTVRALANGNAGANDFVRPGHIFPLIAKDGGVLMRSGHTEAAVDLARLAGLPPVGVICELVNDDGTVKRGPQVQAFAREHGFKVISVADLIAYRQRRERLVDCVGEFEIETQIGKAKGYSYSTPFDDIHHLALVFGGIGDGVGVPTRLHRENVLEDVFGGGRLLGDVFKRFDREGRGVLVYLREGAAGVPVGEFSSSAPPTNSDQSRKQDWRDVGLGAQILRDLGVSSIRLLATRSRQYVGLGGFGVSIDGTELLSA